MQSLLFKISVWLPENGRPESSLLDIW